jgi:hypothetical protein
VVRRWRLIGYFPFHLLLPARDFAILNLFEPSAPWSDGPEVEHGAHFLILYYSPRASLITRSFNGNTVRNFPTHGQLSAAQGNLTSCLNFDFAKLNLFEPSAL